jgi:arginyl-tRNA synthetase
MYKPEARIHHALENLLSEAGIPYTQDEIVLQETRKEFEGDFTFVVFPFAKKAKSSPEQFGIQTGEKLKERFDWIKDFNVIKGFLNISLKPEIWTDSLQTWLDQKEQIGTSELGKGRKVMVEFSSPNTNKPLHLGHLRNIFLGDSLSRILTATQHRVIPVTLVNDRGVHICKSMFAWMKEGNGDTPQSSGLKGDHFVGKYYVLYDKMYKAEIEASIASGISKEEAEKSSTLGLAIRDMLIKWEENDAEIRQIWKMMNGWVLEGFDQTYKKINVSFEKVYYESETYLLGKDLIEEGLNSEVFYKKEDGSIWVDLTAEGLDHKILLRGDGTSVYITQDIGTAALKYEDYGAEKSVYVIANEQDYHMKVLKLILEKLKKPYASGIYHLSYGMVELPSGKMKSREGTVVDADELIDEMIQLAEEKTTELGKMEGADLSELSELYETLGLGAVKYYLIKVEPKKGMLFDPNDSIDFKGNTGPFIQYTYARINSLLQKALQTGYDLNVSGKPEVIEPTERLVLQKINSYTEVLEESASTYNPALLANFIFELASLYNRFYNELPVLKGSDQEVLRFRLALSSVTAKVIGTGLNLLGIRVPNRM